MLNLHRLFLSGMILVMDLFCLAQAQENPLDACRPVSIETLFNATGGHDVSPTDPDRVAYAKIDATQRYQVYVRSLSTGQEQCISCQASKHGVNIDRLHKGAVSFHPDGKHLVLEVEMENHPYPGKLGQPGPGWFTNLWMTTLDGSRWWQLTDYPHGKNDRYGVLLPKISPDGKKVVWAQLYRAIPKVTFMNSIGKAQPHQPVWGMWQINVANLEYDAGQDRYFLSNIKTFEPKSGHFVETGDWAADNRTLLIATDNHRSSPQKLDIWELDTHTGTYKPMVSTDNAWEEFPHYSPDGSKISYMSSWNWDPSQPKYSLHSELFLMDKATRQTSQLTRFNEEDPAYRTIVANSRWMPDGKGMLMEVTRLPRNKKRADNLQGAQTALLHLTFQGACGR